MICQREIKTQILLTLNLRETHKKRFSSFPQFPIHLYL